MSTSAIVERIQHLLERTAPFDRLPEAARAELLTDVSIEVFSAGDVILEQGGTIHRGLFVVESGTVRIMDVVAGRLIDKCGEGDFFGSFGLVKGGASIYEAKALEPTVCAVVKGERFNALYAAHDDFRTHFDADIKRYVRRMGTPVDVSGAHLLFNRPLAGLPLRAPVTCAPDDPVQSVVRTMQAQGVGSVLVQGKTKTLGIITERDLLYKVVGRGLPADTPARRVMSSPILTIDADASLFDAVVRMLHRRVSRLVVERQGAKRPEPVAILTDRDVAHFRGQDPLATVQRIDRVPNVDDLVSIRSETNEQLLRLYRQGVSPERLSRLMAVIYDRFARRALELVEREMKTKTGGPRSDLPWVWLRLGSGGRQEMVLTSEQHNALVYANPADADEAERAEAYFARFTERAIAALEACGFPSGDLVAAQPENRRPLKAWKQAYRRWILQAEGDDLTASLRYFDLRPVYGDAALADELKRDITDALNVAGLDAERHVLSRLAAHVMTYRAPRSFFERFFKERTRESGDVYDVRARGILPVVEAARVLALDLRYLDSTNTFDRLRHAREHLDDDALAGAVEGALDAFQQLSDFRLEDQLNAVEAGEPLDNLIKLSDLTRLQQNLLDGAFKAVSELQDALARYYDVNRRAR